MRLVDAAEFDELVEIVDALAAVVARLAVDLSPRVWPAAEHIAQRAHRLRQMRIG